MSEERTHVNRTRCTQMAGRRAFHVRKIYAHDSGGRYRRI